MNIALIIIITFGWVAWSVYDIHAMNNRLMDILGMDIEPKLKKESLQAVMESHGKRFRIVFTKSFKKAHGFSHGMNWTRKNKFAQLNHFLYICSVK